MSHERRWTTWVVVCLGALAVAASVAHPALTSPTMEPSAPAPERFPAVSTPVVSYRVDFVGDLAVEQGAEGVDCAASALGVRPILDGADLVVGSVRASGVLDEAATVACAVEHGVHTVSLAPGAPGSLESSLSQAGVSRLPHTGSVALGSSALHFAVVGGSVPGFSEISAAVSELRTAGRHTVVVALLAQAGAGGWGRQDHRTLGRELLDLGADLVIGTGSSVLWPVERRRSRYLVPGLGALASPAHEPDLDVRTVGYGGVLRLVASDGRGKPELRLYPLTTGDGPVVRPSDLGELSDLWWTILSEPESASERRGLKRVTAPTRDESGRFISLGSRPKRAARR